MPSSTLLLNSLNEIHSASNVIIPVWSLLLTYSYQSDMVVASVSPLTYYLRAAMDVMRASITDRSMLTELHKQWGGSHDSLLGLLLWIHSIPLYSIYRYNLLHYTLHTTHYTLYTIHYTLYTIHYTLHNARYTLYTIPRRKTQ
jgi:hypothetical protein